MSGARLWLLIGILALSTLLIRGSFLLFPKSTRLPKRFNAALPFVPAAVLAALVSPAVFRLQDSVEFTTLTPRLVAAGLALVIAWRTNNILFTLLSGMLSLWVMRWLLNQ